MPDPLTDDQIARLRELLTDATRGPWGAEETYPGSGRAGIRGEPPEGVVVADDLRPEDGQLIEAAVNALPVLLVEIDQLKADLETAEDDVLRAISERNEVARIAAAEIHPGPDGADDEIRRGLIRDWLDEGRDDAEGWREKFQLAVLKPCPHIQTSDDGTSHCSLAEAACDRAEEATS